VYFCRICHIGNNSDSIVLFYALHVHVFTDCTAKASENEHTVEMSVMGHLTNEAAKRTVVLCGIKKGTDRQVVEKLAGNLKRVRQLRYPFVMHDGASELCAAIIYRGKRDAVKAVHRLDSQTLAGFMLMISIYN